MEKKQRTGIDLIEHEGFLDIIRNICSEELQGLYASIKAGKYWHDKREFLEWVTEFIPDKTPLPIKLMGVLNNFGYTGDLKDTRLVVKNLMNIYRAYIGDITRDIIPDSEIFHD